MAEIGKYRVDYDDSVWAADLGDDYGDGALAKDIAKLSEWIVTDRKGRNIRQVRIEVDYASSSPTRPVLSTR